MKKFLAVCFLVCMVFAMMAGCKDKTVDAEQAKKIVLEELGMSEKEANPHVHVGDYNGKPCYSVYVTVNGKNVEYLVDSKTGDILAVRDSNHSH